MQNIATTVASKAIVAAVAAAMIFSAFAAPVKAQSVEDLQKMINDLMSQISALQGQGGTSGSVASGVCPFTWTRDLRTGMTGADVMKLQQFLNSNADTRVAASGAGSVGAETQYFGPATAAAVSKFQVMHRADILTPAGLTNPTGFFGPSTRAKANALCVTPGTVDEDEDEEGSEDEDEDMELSGEAELTSVELSSADEDQIEEGATDAPVAELTVEFEDGDASISRIDVSISSTSVDSWDVLETVSLWVDGDMVAEMDAADEDDYLDEDDGTLRFSGLDIVAMEDEELDIIIGVTLQNNIDNDDMTTFDVSVDAIRYFDADGVATTEDNVGDMGASNAVEFTIEEAGFEDEILVKTSSSDPDATTIQVEDDSKSDFETVFIFDIDTDDSINDIEINEATIALTLSAAYNVLVDDAELVIDGVTIDDFSVSNATATNPTLTFDVDGDVTIDAGDRVAAELKLRFKALTVEGATVRASISGTGAIEGEGADDVNSSGAATGDIHTLRSTGITVSVEDTDAAVTVADGNTNDYATFTMDLEVTAFEQDVYLSTNPSVSTDWDLVDGAGNVISIGTSTVVLTSSGDEESGYFEIKEGETETITIKVTYVPGATNTAARLQLLELNYRDTAAAPNTTWDAEPVTDYRTAVVTIVN